MVADSARMAQMEAGMTGEHQSAIHEMSSDDTELLMNALRECGSLTRWRMAMRAPDSAMTPTEPAHVSSSGDSTRVPGRLRVPVRAQHSGSAPRMAAVESRYVMVNDLCSQRLSSNEASRRNLDSTGCRRRRLAPTCCIECAGTGAGGATRSGRDRSPDVICTTCRCTRLKVRALWRG